jgi:hypothetical protein
MSAGLASPTALALSKLKAARPVESTKLTKEIPDESG